MLQMESCWTFRNPTVFHCQQMKQLCLEMSRHDFIQIIGCCIVVPYVYDVQELTFMTYIFRVYDVQEWQLSSSNRLLWVSLLVSNRTLPNFQQCYEWWRGHAGKLKKLLRRKILTTRPHSCLRFTTHRRYPSAVIEDLGAGGADRRRRANYHERTTCWKTKRALQRYPGEWDIIGQKNEVITSYVSTKHTRARSMHRRADIYIGPMWCCRCIRSAKFRQYISAIFALHGMFGNASCYFVSDWLMQIFCPASQISVNARSPRLYQVVCNNPGK